MVLVSAGGAGGTEGGAVDAPVGSALLFAVAQEAAEGAHATFGGRGSGYALEWLALSPG